MCSVLGWMNITSLRYYPSRALITEDFWQLRAEPLQLFHHDKIFHICQPAVQSVGGSFGHLMMTNQPQRQQKCLQGCTSELDLRCVRTWKDPLKNFTLSRITVFLAVSLIGRVALNVLSCQTWYVARIYESGWTFKTHIPQKDQGRRCMFLFKNESTQGGCADQKQTSDSPGSLSWERLDFLIKW